MQKYVTKLDGSSGYLAGETGPRMINTPFGWLLHGDQDATQDCSVIWTKVLKELMKLGQWQTIS